MKQLLFTCCILALAAGCKQRYDPPVNNPITGYMVVDGIINSGQGPTNITLSRTTRLTDSTTIKYELKAVVRVEGEGGGSFPLTEKGRGVYSADQLTLNSSQKYRLYIKTADGKEYISDFTTIKKTPPVDSIPWELLNGGVQLYINTHDPTNNTRYYRWEYEQTWEFHSTYPSSLKFNKNSNGTVTGISFRFPNEMFDPKLYYCWQSENSTNILLGSSAKLSLDTIHSPVALIPLGSWKLNVLFSINVRQYAQSQEAYEFLTRMKKNTEQTGSIFDAQPSELKGNIHSMNNASEIVIGFIEVADAREKRIFINAGSLPPATVPTNCEQLEVANDASVLDKYATSIPTYPIKEGVSPAAILSLGVSSPLCVDCTLRGTNIKPSFWP